MRLKKRKDFQFSSGIALIKCSFSYGNIVKTLFLIFPRKISKTQTLLSLAMLDFRPKLDFSLWNEVQVSHNQNVSVGGLLSNQGIGIKIYSLCKLCSACNRGNEISHEIFQIVT